MIVRRLLVNGGSDTTVEVAELVGQLAARGGLDPAQAYRLRLAADEITTNIACHGYRGRSGPIELSGDIDGERVWLCIEDDAPPFDPLGHHPDPRLSAAPPLREVGGLGLHLALTVVDEFSYDRARGRNRNLLALNRPGSGRFAQTARPVMNDGGTDGRHNSASRC